VTREVLPVPRSGEGTLSSVRNAARVLAAFTPADRDVGVTELAARLGLAKSTVHRLLSALVSEDLVERSGTRGRYRIGLRLYELGAMAPSRADLHLAAVGPIDDLLARTGESVHVAVLDRADVVAVDRREAPMTLRLVSRLGYRHPAHATSAGKALLAYLSLSERSALFERRELAALTQYTITDRARLEEELAKVRSRGWAETVHEHELGIASVAAPIRDARGRVVAAVGVVGPSARFGRENVRRLSLETVRTAEAISARLGYRARETGVRAGR
jgi:IclR family KDG regulon transcriptional repressor